MYTDMLDLNNGIWYSDLWTFPTTWRCKFKCSARRRTISCCKDKKYYAVCGEHLCWVWWNLNTTLSLNWFRYVASTLHITVARDQELSLFTWLYQSYIPPGWVATRVIHLCRKHLALRETLTPFTHQEVEFLDWHHLMCRRQKDWRDFRQVRSWPQGLVSISDKTSYRKIS